MTNQQNRWAREELILTFSVYFQLPFGRLKHENIFGCIAGQQLIMPIEHRPNRDYLAYHRDRIFKGI